MEKLHCSRKIGVSLLGITFALVLGIIVSRIDGTFLLARSNNDVTSYSLTLSNSNKYSGSATKQISTDSGGSKVQFSYTSASSSASGHVKLSADGTIKNDTQITSITNILPSFTCNNGVSLKFRASFDGNKWGDYTSLASGSSFDLSESKPYFIEFKADGGTVDVNAIKFTYSCMDNPSAHGESGPSEFKKVTSNLADFSGTYLIVYTDGPLAFDGSLDILDDTNNNFSVSIKNDSITYSQEIASKTFEIAKIDGGYSIKASNGKYIGNNSNSNALTANDGELKNTISYSDDTLNIVSSGGAYLRYNASNDQSRFRYFKSSTYTGQKPIDLYKLENGGTIVGTPSYEVGLTVNDSKSSSYTVNDTFNSFVTNGGLTATAKMSDGSTKTLNKSEFSYILKYQGEVVDSSKTFAHAGTYDVYVSYKSLVPVKYSITVANVVTSITANKTKTTYSVGDAISLSDITVTKNYKVDGSSVVINYADFSSNSLSCELKNPNGVVVSSGTFNVAGYWNAKVYLTSNPSISSSISISVSTVEVTSISLNKSNTTISIGNNETLVATVLPSNATNKNVTWTSSDSTVASVVNGIVTGVSEGNATITAKAGNLSASCYVTVEKVHVTGISLTETTKSLDVGSSSTLTATITPSNATDKSVTWTSSDTGVASVNANGVISALRAGTTIITVKTNDGGKTASCTLTVKNVDVTSITLSQTSLELYINGNSETLTATILPDNATIKTITWTSSDSSVASVNNGVVTPVGAGTTTITASCGGKSATCNVTVSSEPQVKRGTAQFNFFNNDAIDETSGTNADTTYVLSKLSFSDDSLKASEFLSSFNSSGTVQYDKNGGLTIGASKNSASATFNFTSDYKITKVEVVGTVYDSNIPLKLNDSTGEGSLNPKGTNLLSCNNTLVWDNLDKLSSFTLSSSKRTTIYTLKCYYEASQQGGGGEEVVPVNGVSVSPTSQTLVVDQTLQLNPTITPSNATDKSVSYSSSNVTVASVSSSGIVTAKNSGSAIITVTSNYDRSIFATCNITVQEASVSVTSVSLSSSSETISVGGSITLTATISPSNATNKNVTWSSTDSSVASVFEGVVTGVKVGTTTIKVTTQDGNKTASCSITVTSSGGQTTGSITIVSDDAPDKYGSDSTKTISGYDFVFNNVGNSYISGYMQFKASAGYIYNSSAINGITSITIDSGDKTWGGSVYYGTSSKPVTVANKANLSNGKYVIPSGNSYFNITKDSKNAGYIKSITIEYSTTPPTPINPTGISIPSSAEIGVGSSKTLDVTFTPSGCNTNKGISWISSNSSIVSVSQGTITGVKAGTATITATSTYDTNLKSSCTVTVTQQKADTWTILMYVCGADLESESGLASGDFEEILSVRNQPDDVNIVIQTGGAKSWDSSYGYGINASYNQRYHVENRQLVCDNSKVYNTYTSMGVSTTLKDFITWGMQTYPAEKTGLVFWNHGGGMRGVCYDEKKSDDSLKNSEIKSAVSGAMTTLNRTEKLEFIGFDACLMQVQDIAEFMSPYFNYMVGSEESEAGYGWDYDNWVDDLYAKKDTTVILKAICDSFIADNGGVSSTRNDQTLSYLNLQYASEYKTAWENFASALSTKLGSTSANTFSSWVVSNVKHYADSDYNYFHLFDAKDFVNKVASNSSYNPGSTYTSAVLTAHSKLVGYSTCGKGAGNSYGLCCVYVCTQDRDYALINNYYTTSETNFTTWRTFCTKYGDLK